MLVVLECQGVAMHIDVACRSVCNWDQKWNQAINVLRYLAGVATFCPLNSCRIKHSRASEQSNHAIKDDFHRSRFLVAVANASTGNVHVTTP